MPNTCLIFMPTTCLVCAALRENSLNSIPTKAVPYLPCSITHTSKTSVKQLPLSTMPLLPWLPKQMSSPFRIQIKCWSLQEACPNSSIWIKCFSGLSKHSTHSFSTAFFTLNDNFLLTYTSPYLDWKLLEGLGVSHSCLNFCCLAQCLDIYQLFKKMTNEYRNK